MLFMLIVKASTHTEAGMGPNEKLNEAMSQYNKALVEAGVRVRAKGLHPSEDGILIAYPIEGGAPVVTEGPFENPENLVAGFILIDVPSREAAIEWAMKMPDPMGKGEGMIELRQVNE